MAGGGGGHDGSSGGGGLIFVYGTLKRGFPNHALIDDLVLTGDAAYLGPRTTAGAFPLVCGPHGIPFLLNLPGSGHRVRGELYSVSPGRGLALLDDLEGVGRGHYERLPVAVDGGGEAEAYFAHRGFGEALWKRCGEVGLAEYSAEMGNNFTIDVADLDKDHRMSCALMASSSSDKGNERRLINSGAARLFQPVEKIELAHPSNPI